jgi:hypothetical protein
VVGEVCIVEQLSPIVPHIGPVKDEEQLRTIVLLSLVASDRGTKKLRKPNLSLLTCIPQPADDPLADFVGIDVDRHFHVELPLLAETAIEHRRPAGQ